MTLPEVSAWLLDDAESALRAHGARVVDIIRTGPSRRRPTGAQRVLCQSADGAIVTLVVAAEMRREDARPHPGKSERLPCR